jgi:hypothetical protein
MTKCSWTVFSQENVDVKIPKLTQCYFSLSIIDIIIFK